MSKTIIEVKGGLVTKVETDDTHGDIIIVDRDVEGFKPKDKEGNAKPFMEYRYWPDTQPGELFKEVEKAEKE